MTHLVFLTNFIPPYREPVLRLLKNSLRKLTVLVSVQQESNRLWKPSAVDFDVIQQKNITLHWKPRFEHGVSDVGYLHIPYNTLAHLHQLKPNIILSGEMGARTLQAALYCRWFAKSTSLIIHADLSEATESCRNGFMRRMLRRWLLKQADAIIVNGASGKRYIQSLVPEHKFIVPIPYTADIKNFSQARTSWGRDSSQPIKLLYVGHLVHLKGLLPFTQNLIHWAIANPRVQIHWQLIGHGELLATLQQITYPPNLQVEFTGHVDYQTLPYYYAKADMFVFPSFADTWGVVVNEAMAAGLPVLGSLYSQAVEEMVQDGKTGWTFYPDQPETIQRAFAYAFNLSSEQLAEMQLNAHTKAMQFSPEYVTQKILDVIAATYSA